jgi:predicted TIM-barrel fold metal-dependent hydrolase
MLNADRMRRVLQDFPCLRVSVPHLGVYESDSFMDLVDEFSNLWLDTTGALLTNGYFGDTDVDLDRLRRIPHRLLFGSDFPIVPVRYDDEVNSLLRVGFSFETLESIFYSNAVEFVGLHPV